MAVQNLTPIAQSANGSVKVYGNVGAAAQDQLVNANSATATSASDPNLAFKQMVLKKYGGGGTFDPTTGVYSYMDGNRPGTVSPSSGVWKAQPAQAATGTATGSDGTAPDTSGLTPQPVTAAPSQPSVYKIQAGDTLSKIAEQNSTNIQALMATNPNITNPNLIKAGVNLNIPAGSTLIDTSKLTGNAKYQAQLKNKLNSTTDLNNVGAVRGVAGAVTAEALASAPVPQSPAMTAFDQFLGTYSQQVMDYMSPNNQKQSFVDEYNSLKGSLGIDDLNTQLINIKNVMNGTEDDIRTEVTKAGGFASESQVQAMVYARNKNLVKQATFLQDTLNTKEDTLNTLLSLDEKDRAAADTKFNTTTGIAEKMMTLQQSMQKNARDNYQAVIDNVGYTGLAAQSDPFTRRLAEQSLGLPSGFLDNPPLTAKQTTEVLAQKRFDVSEKNADSRLQLSIAASDRATAASERAATRADALNIQTYTRAANTLIGQQARQDPVLKAFSGSAVYLNRLQAAITDPGTIGDQEILDALTQLNSGGNRVTEAQVNLIGGNLSYADQAKRLGQKINGQGGALTPALRTQALDLAKKTYNSYEKSYQQRIGQYQKRVENAGIPLQYSPLTDISNLDSFMSGTDMGSTGGGSVSIGGSNSLDSTGEVSIYGDNNY